MFKLRFGYITSCRASRACFPTYHNGYYNHATTKTNQAKPKDEKRMVLSLPVGQLVMLAKVELLVAACFLAFDFVRAVLTLTVEDMGFIWRNARSVLRNVCYELGITVWCLLLWGVLDFLDGGMHCSWMSWIGFCFGKLYAR